MFNRRPCLAFFPCFGFILLVGCASPVRTVGLLATRGWYDEYQAAERAAARSGRAIFIHYTDAEPARPDPMAGILQTPAVRERINSLVPCRLYKEHEADRRYMAQFGLERAPSLVILHPDGTFHARAGDCVADDVLAFLNQAVPPGRTPVLNPLIPRRVGDFWYESLSAAEHDARISGKPLLVVYYRSFSRDWSRLEPLLDDELVVARLGAIVPCRIAVGGWFPEAHVSPFGAVHLPTVVLADAATRQANILEKPQSADSIARLLANGPNGGQVAGELAPATP
jgi:hypothetical protein